MRRQRPKSKPTKQPAPPRYAEFPAGFPGEFVQFHLEHDWAYEGIVARARELKARGFGNVGVRYLFEDLRYTQSEHVERPPDVEFGLNNNFASWYGRLIESRELDLTGFFRLRRTRRERLIPDPSQTCIEFD